MNTRTRAKACLVDASTAEDAHGCCRSDIRPNAPSRQNRWSSQSCQWQRVAEHPASPVGLYSLRSPSPRDPERGSGPGLGHLGLEPVSVESRTGLCLLRNSCREKVWRGQRPGRDFWRRTPIPRDRDWPLSRLSCQSRGKLKTIPTATGNRICAGLRGGAGRTRTCKQAIMAFQSAAARPFCTTC